MAIHCVHIELFISRALLDAAVRSDPTIERPPMPNLLIGVTATSGK
jgi:hypothetical protein